MMTQKLNASSLISVKRSEQIQFVRYQQRFAMQLSPLFSVRIMFCRSC